MEKQVLLLIAALVSIIGFAGVQLKQQFEGSFLPKLESGNNKLQSGRYKIFAYYKGDHGYQNYQCYLRHYISHRIQKNYVSCDDLVYRKNTTFNVQVNGDESINIYDDNNNYWYTEIDEPGLSFTTIYFEHTQQLNSFQKKLSYRNTGLNNYVLQDAYGQGIDLNNLVDFYTNGYTSLIGGGTGLNTFVFKRV